MNAQHLQSAVVAVSGVATDALAIGAGLLAQAEVVEVVEGPAQQSIGMALFGSLGFCGWLAVLSGIAIFAGAWIVVFRRPAVIASYMVLLALPPLLALAEVLRGGVAALHVLVYSEGQIKASQLVEAIHATLLLPLMTVMIILPSFVILSVGLFLRTLQADRDQADRDSLRVP